MRFLSAGPDALLVELEGLREAHALAAEIERRRQDGWRPELIDVVPGARTVLLDGLDDPGATGRELATWTVRERPAQPAPEIEIPCRYDGPDLAGVAELWGVSVEQAIALHAGIEHEVAFCGFGPGFAYIAGLGEDQAVARHEQPRPRVEAGSVAVADRYTGVYPRPSPGGWRIIGHTEVTLWDLERDPPSLLIPGARVRFIAA